MSSSAASGELLFVLSIVSGLLWTTRRLHSHIIADLTAEINRERKLRLSEREGRIQAQKQQRSLKIHEQEESGYRFKPIGHIESPFRDRRGTPRQPILGTLFNYLLNVMEVMMDNSDFITW